MLLGRVCGTIHSTINHQFYDNKRLLLVDRLKKDGSPSGKYLIAVDTVDAGAGETVLVIDEGNSARQIINDTSAPVRSVIIGIVDHVNISRNE
jgi:ethanolamine utilization protein EutN